MNIYLKAGSADQIPGDMLLKVAFRSDLAPVPRTLEVTTRIKDGIENHIKEGEFLWGGHENLKYRIVKVNRLKPSGMLQGEDELAAMHAIALLDSCAQIAFRRDRAVIADNATLGSLYRACGATLAIGDDFTVRRFACFTGNVPSFHLAKAMQEECACLVLRNGRLSVVRLPNLFQQTPKDIIGQVDSADGIESEFMQRHEIPSFFSLADDGSFVFGDRDKTRAVSYLPRTTEIALRNMSRVLVTKKIMDSNMAQQVSAGDLISIKGSNYAVVTACHYMDQNDGVSTTNSRFWLGELSA